MEYFCRWNQYHSQYDCDRVDSKHAVLFQGCSYKRSQHRFVHLINKQAYTCGSADSFLIRHSNDYNNAVDLDCPKWYGYD